MNAATKIASTSAAVALVLVGMWLFWPTSLGGATTYLVTHGQSMEPGFSTGDLAVLRPPGSYEVGDVVAYRSESLDTVVMHRIVAVDGDRFVIQGDNNDWLDADRPTEDELLGSLFRQVPQGGRILDAVASPWSLALIAAAVLGVSSTSRRGPRGSGRHSAHGPARHRSHRPARRSPVVPTSLPVAFSMPTRAQARQVGIGAGVVAVLAAVGGAALLALPSTETGTRTEDVTQEGRFTYAGDARVGTTYPTGEISTGDPVYTRLADAVTVSFEHTVSAAGLDEVAGTVRLDLAVTSGDGWSAPLGSSPATPVQDGTAVASALLDPVRAANLVDRHDAEIGGSAGSASIVVTPVVDITGSLAGRSFTATQPAAFTFAMDGVALRPTADEAAYTPAASVPVTLEEVVPRTFTPLGVDLPIGLARVLAIVVLLGAVLVAAVAGGIAHSYTGDAADAFAIRNAARILPVAGLTPGRSVVDLSDAQALRRVAERVDGLVLHHAGTRGSDLRRPGQRDDLPLRLPRHRDRPDAASATAPAGAALAGRAGHLPAPAHRLIPAAASACPRASAAPEVEAVAAGPEARRLHDVDGEVELLPDRGRVVGVAPEADRLPALVVEPAHLVRRRQRAAGVDLQRPAGAGQRAEDRPVLLLVVLLHEAVRAPGPVPAREVDVREHLEDGAALDHVHQLGEVAAHRAVLVLPQQVADAVEPPVLRQGVQRAQDPVDRSVAQVGGHAAAEQVRLAGLHARQDPQVREPVAHLGELGEVPLDVDLGVPGRVPLDQAFVGRPVVGVPDGEVEVLGEGDRRQPQLHRPLAGPAHRRRVGGVP